MTTHPFRDVAIVGVYNTEQAKVIEGHDARSLAMEAGRGALADAHLRPQDVDGVIGHYAPDFIYQHRIGPAWLARTGMGVPAVLEGATAIAAGLAEVVVIPSGAAGTCVERGSTAPWTRPDNEFVACFGMFTAAEFALVARRHMHLYGTTPEALATVAATIRNNGHVNPCAVYRGKGPFTAEDILASRMIADPFHLLDCAITSEGGCGMVLARADRAADLGVKSVYILGGNVDYYGPPYQHPPTLELGGRGDRRLTSGSAGRRAAEQAFRSGGLTPSDVDVCELYDPFSFEVIRQLEAFGMCAEGEGGDYVMSGAIGPGGDTPVTTDGGLLSYSHAGATPQMLQRVTRAVEQLRGECETCQVPGAEVALCSGGGAGALFTDVLLLGVERP